VSGNVLVIGESCVDTFVYCEVIRLAPDVPVPVLRERTSTPTQGMAMNVYNNIRSLGSDVDIITNSNWDKMTKTRFVHDSSNHMFFRVDSEPDAADPFPLHLMEYDYNTIVIADYDKGFLSEDMINKICMTHPNVFLDTKKVLGPWAYGARYIKINQTEYEKSKHAINGRLKDKIIHTTGPGGCEFQGVNFPVVPSEIKDVSGAGDTFMAALVVKFGETKDIGASIEFANQCASEIVKHRGVTVI